MLNVIGSLDGFTPQWSLAAWTGWIECGRAGRDAIAQRGFRVSGLQPDSGFNRAGKRRVHSGSRKARRTGERERADTALQRLGLGDLGDRRPGELSGGQQQRVAIARAIVTEPVLLLADEPTATLDSKTTEELLGLLRDLNQQQGMTIVTATHDPIVMSYTSRQVALLDGEIHQDSASAV